MDTLQIDLKNISKHFGNVHAVNDISLKVQKGSILSIVGPSGCGKTTLLRLIAGFESPDRGELQIGGSPIWSKDYSMPVQERNIGMIFQDGALFPHLNVKQNIGFAVSENVDSLLNLVGLVGKETSMPHELSGGEQQRVALARSLAANPSTLLLDEPFSNLDIQIRRDIRTEVRSILKSYNVTAIFVTHDQQEASEMGDQIAIMKDGAIEQIGNPEEVYVNPQTEFTAKFFSQANLVDGTLQKKTLKTFISETDLSIDKNMNGNIKLVIHPNQLSIESASDSNKMNGTVRKQIFQGNEYFYTIELENKEIVNVLQSNKQPIEPNTPVKITYTPGKSVICFQEGAQKKFKVNQ